jgi:hypothetical protein
MALALIVAACSRGSSRGTIGPSSNLRLERLAVTGSTLVRGEFFLEGTIASTETGQPVAVSPGLDVTVGASGGSGSLA